MASQFDDDYSLPKGAKKPGDAAGAQPGRKSVPTRSQRIESQHIEPKQIDPKQFHPKRIEHKQSLSTASLPAEATTTNTGQSGLSSSLLGWRWLKSWPMVVLIIFGILGTAGTVAVVSLFRIPNLPNCRAIFWPTASASLRLQCAESYAQQGDVDNLLAAIALVDRLPEDHPLRADINERIEDWANQVLNLAERSFEAGDLEGRSPRRIRFLTGRRQKSWWQSGWSAGSEFGKQASRNFRRRWLRLKRKIFRRRLACR